ncbi:molybdate ABC transporter substrate-binding protein [Rhodothermus profundi]|uniref:Molybdate transport system substrate-binding protein n=1 Tax=Rhodothermus profundi TaxID=633813 RepID=A0A1M6XRD9_9BACT|nr:molybdate ABC transporter substrate-binding protein [Rhodothermus profundi]SHL08385.1 molybdate transport system substrate-binding protein [Rhodothermus profundi]
MSKHPWFKLLLGLLLALGGCRRAEHPADVQVAVASDLRYAFEALRARFEAVYPNIRLIPSYGASGQLFTQLQNGAPFDLYFSADADYPRRLIAEGLAVDSSFFQYALGQLVVWVPEDSPLTLASWEELAGPQVHRLALANPRHAPYGRAAVAALKALGLYARVRDRLVFGENVAQAAQFVASGAADAGLIALSLARAPEMQERGRYRPLPPETYPPIEQGAVVLQRAAHRPEVWTFWRFVQRPEGRAVLRQYGFALPDATDHPES